MPAEVLRGIVTGASGGLGRELTLQLLRRGHRVVATALHAVDLDAAFEKEAGCWTIPLDLRRRGSQKDLARFAEQELGGLDFLFHVAGMVHGLKPVEELGARALADVFEVNVFSVFHLLKWALPVMRRDLKGREKLIVSIASYGAWRGVPGMSAYCASKAALRLLIQCVAKEQTDDAIRCVSVSPRGMNTEMRAELFGEEDARAQMDPGKVAGLILDTLRQGTVPNGSDIIIQTGYQVDVRPPEP